MNDLVHGYFMVKLLVFTFISKAVLYHRNKERVLPEGLLGPVSMAAIYPLCYSRKTMVGSLKL